MTYIKKIQTLSKKRNEILLSVAPMLTMFMTHPVHTHPVCRPRCWWRTAPLCRASCARSRWERLQAPSCTSSSSSRAMSRRVPSMATSRPSSTTGCSLRDTPLASVTPSPISRRTSTSRTRSRRPRFVVVAVRVLVVLWGGSRHWFLQCGGGSHNHFVSLVSRVPDSAWLKSWLYCRCKGQQ